MKNVLIVLALLVIAGGGYWVYNKGVLNGPTSQTETQTCDGRDAMEPYIISINPTSAPAGSKVTINGCNLSGFEGDLIATFVRSDNKTITLNGGTYYRQTPEIAEATSMTVTVATYCPNGSMVGEYSGEETPCTTVEAVPGTYGVYVQTPGGKSNTVSFTVK